MAQWFNRPGSNLATLARETGYPVIEVPGWSTRGHGGFAGHVGVTVCHHTAGPEPQETASNYPSLRVVRDGRTGLPGPLSNFGIGYDGTIYVIAAGMCYHAGRGGWAGFSGNSTAIGIEAEDGGDGDWTAAQRDVYPRLVARICQFLGISEAGVCGHKEWAPRRKIDPAGIDMGSFRRQVDAYLAAPHTIHRSNPAPTTEEDDMQPWDLLDTPTPVWGGGHPEDEMPHWQQTQQGRTYGMWGWRNTVEIKNTMNKILDLVAKQNGVTPGEIAEALRPLVSEDLGPVVSEAVSEALGADNTAQAEAVADAVLTKIAGRLAAGQNPEEAQ